MKKVFIICLFIIFSIFFSGCTNTSKLSINNYDYLRLHIRANSNNMEDQNIKYIIKDKIIEYLTPIISACNTKQEMQTVLQTHFKNIQSVTNKILIGGGFEYSSNIKMNKEFFPTRTYGNYTLEADYYDALIVELGNANGDNWWCVVYPPLCFLNASDTNISGFKYKSIIKELIEKFFK